MIASRNKMNNKNNIMMFNGNKIVKNKKEFIRNYGPTTHVALFTNARDEVHMKEWVAHHLLLGFDIIIIFDHKSIIPLKNELSIFGDKIKVFRSDNDSAIKIPFMNKAIQMSRKMNVDWFIYLDADEFIILNTKENNIKYLLNFYNNAHSLAINWLFFGSNYLEKEPEGLILESYTKSSKLLDKHVKSFVRPYEATYADNPHFYHIRNKKMMYGLNKQLNTSQESASFNSSFCIEHTSTPAYIAHYIYQSEETCLNRKIKLPTDDLNVFRNVLDVKFIHNLYNEEDNFYPRDTYAENVKNYIKQLDN